MCTVTFIGRKRGYLLAMNRDEKLTRPKGLPPRIRAAGGSRIASPSEPGGGSWIALNDSGATFALINWYAVEKEARGNRVSRGVVVDLVSAHSTSDGASEALNNLPLKRLNPFRLVGVFPGSRQLFEWRWDLKRLVERRHAWQACQFISSGFDESEAQRVRGREFRTAQLQRSAGSGSWLRRLHRSHRPERGPFSTCMHRSDAATVSYTEVVVRPGRRVLRYQRGAPCEGEGFSVCRV